MAAIATVVAMALGPLRAPLQAATTEQIVTDRRGLGIAGFDPVAYFTDGAAFEGDEDLEHPFAGVVWRFRNIGNRAAFAAAPEVYMPQFGGHDPMLIAQGAPVPGDPRIWLIHERRLYLFHSPATRFEFAADPARMVAAATARWGELKRTLAP